MQRRKKTLAQRLEKHVRTREGGLKRCSPSLMNAAVEVSEKVPVRDEAFSIRQFRRVSPMPAR